MTDDAQSASFRRPESVLVVIHTAERDCLLLERRTPAGFWQSVTGSLDWDETPAEAAARELAEETGLAAAGLRDAATSRRFPILPAWRPRYAPDVSENCEHWFYLELASACDVTIDPAEHRQYRWLGLDKAIATASSWTNRQALEALRWRDAGD